MASKPKLYTLSDAAKKTGISLPTLQRYKKLYQSRIPSVGTGRKQRYPKEALAEFRKIKRENLKKRGRPRKKAAAGKGASGRKKTARKAKSGKAKKRKSTARKTTARKKTARRTTARKTKTRAKTTKRGKATTRKKGTARRKPAKRRAKKTAARRARGPLLSLSEIGRRTGISYPTLMRYVKLQLDKIPHVIEGSRRLFPEEAVEVFRTIRASTRRGRRKGSVSRVASAAVPMSGALSSKIRQLEKAQKQIAKQLRDVLDHLRKPLEVTVKRK